MKSLPLAALLLGGVIGGALGASALSAGPMPKMSDVLGGVIPAGGHGGPPHGGLSGRGPMGGMPMMEVARAMDTNNDKALTQDEIDAYVAQKVQLGDANGDGNLTLDEFQTVWLSVVRPMMVDRFQELDGDGDGVVTEAERSQRFGEVVAELDRNGDGKLDRADFGPRGRGGRGHERGERAGDREERGERVGDREERGERGGDDEEREERGERAEEPGAPAAATVPAPVPTPAN